MAEQASSKQTPPSHQSAFDVMNGLTPQRSTPAEPVIPATASGASKPEEKPEPATPAAPAVETRAEDTPPETPALDFDGITDDKLVEILAKRTGRKFESIEDFKAPPKAPTKEEIEAAAEAEKKDSLEWALATDVINRDFYDQGVIARSKDNRAIALEVFSQDLRSEDPNLTDAECEERFKDYYREELEEKDWRRKKAIAQMNAVADAYCAPYKTIDEIPTKFREYKEQESFAAAFRKEVSAAAKEVPASFTFEIPYKSVDGAELPIKIDIPVEDGLITKVVKELQAIPQMKQAYTGKDFSKHLVEEISYHVWARSRDKIMAAYAEARDRQVETDILAKLKNAKNPQQMLGTEGIPAAPVKTPPSHEEAFKKMK